MADARAWNDPPAFTKLRTLRDNSPNFVGRAPDTMSFPSRSERGDE
jgi:hypothetical protein